MGGLSHMVTHGVISEDGLSDMSENKCQCSQYILANTLFILEKKKTFNIKEPLAKLENNF